MPFAFNTFAASSPPWSLQALDNNFAALVNGSAALNVASVVTPLVQAASGDLTLSTATSGRSVKLVDATNSFVSPTQANLGVAALPWNSIFTPVIDSGTTGSLSLRTNNGTTHLVINDFASAVNLTALRGAATGSGPFLGATGADTNIDYNIFSKGAGSINFQSDGSAVTQFQVVRTAGANRNITVTGSNGGSPVIDVTAGALRLSSGTADIQWGKALVALGGGAAPTFGTIGGSGPTTAAQNTWMRLLDSTGAAFWVPAWK